jgi:hypothetical protein
MRNYLLITGCLCLMILSTSCKKGKTTPVGIFKGKVVLIGCGVVAIDIEGATGTGGGVVWTSGGVTYNNAVTAKNFCYIVDRNVKNGDTITFNITTENVSPGPNCAVPQCYISGPISSPVYVTDVVIVN